MGRGKSVKFKYHSVDWLFQKSSLVMSCQLHMTRLHFATPFTSNKIIMSYVMLSYHCLQGTLLLSITLSTHSPSPSTLYIAFKALLYCLTLSNQPFQKSNGVDSCQLSTTGRHFTTLFTSSLTHFYTKAHSVDSVFYYPPPPLRPPFTLHSRHFYVEYHSDSVDSTFP